MKRILSLLSLAITVSFFPHEFTTGQEIQAKLSITMTGNLAPYDAVIISVSQWALHHSGGGWVVVNTGGDVVLGPLQSTPALSVPLGNYTQIRLIIGQGSNVVVNGQTHNLEVASSEAKLNYQFTVEEGFQYELVLNFDAARSIVRMGGKYILKPIIRVETIRVQPLASPGSISGIVSAPMAASIQIMATSSGHTATTVANLTGAFQLTDLPPAEYNLKIQALPLMYRDTTITGVQVTGGDTTNVGTIVLGSIFFR